MKKGIVVGDSAILNDSYRKDKRFLKKEFEEEMDEDSEEVE